MNKVRSSHEKIINKDCQMLSINILKKILKTSKCDIFYDMTFVRKSIELYSEWDDSEQLERNRRGKNLTDNDHRIANDILSKNNT